MPQVLSAVMTRSSHPPPFLQGREIGRGLLHAKNQAYIQSLNAKLDQVGAILKIR
jgi:hypothetical protein